MDDSSLYKERLCKTDREIRLLLIQARDGRDLIYCSLIKTPLELGRNAPTRFNALSYVWGNPNICTPIYVDGVEKAVTKNLELALRSLRDHRPPEAEDIPLWVDAVCINQKDQQERNDQVAIMGDIYRTAERVLIWLGEGDAASDWALQRFRTPAFRLEIEQVSQVTSGGPSAEAIKARVAINLNLDQRFWWTRVWVIQEVLLAKKDPILICGAHNLGWADYCFYQNNLPGSSGSPASYLTHWEHWESAWKDIPQHPDGISADRMAEGLYIGGQATIWDGLRQAMTVTGRLHLPWVFLARFFKSHATDKRDYVYAFRGLLPPAEYELIPVDYALPPMDVYHHALVALWSSALKDSIPLFVSALSYHRHAISGVPSWVPDLSAQKAADVEGYDDDFLREAIKGPWRGPINPRISQDKMVLELEGTFFDTVNEIHEVRFEGKMPNLTDLKAVESVALATSKRDVPTTSHLHKWKINESPSRSMVKIFETFTTLKMGASDEQQRIKSKMWQSLFEQGFDVPLPEILQIIKELHEALHKRLLHRKVFITEAGFFGVGPRHLAVGDQIVWAFGMLNPWLVRQCQGSKSTPNPVFMIGAAFIWDLFDFERLEWALKEEALLKCIISLH